VSRFLAINIEGKIGQLTVRRTSSFIKKTVLHFCPILETIQWLKERRRRRVQTNLINIWNGSSCWPVICLQINIVYQLLLFIANAYFILFYFAILVFFGACLFLVA
jgi:hypothetical protein